MRYIAAFFIIVLTMSCNGQKTSYTTTNIFQLAPPQLITEQVLFKDSTRVVMNFSFPETTIHYTLDGSEVTTESMAYTAPITLNSTAVVKAKNFHQDFQSSPTVSISVARIYKNRASTTISITPEPHERYEANGAKSLTDSKKGSLQFSNDDTWLGFQTDTISLNMSFSKATHISKIVLSTMKSHGNWIFSPKAILVFSQGKKVGSTILPLASQQDIAELQFIQIPIKKQEYTTLKVLVVSLDEIPEWHQGKDTPAWTFIDEILIE